MDGVCILKQREAAKQILVAPPFSKPMAAQQGHAVLYEQTWLMGEKEPCAKFNHARQL